MKNSILRIALTAALCALTVRPSLAQPEGGKTKGDSGAPKSDGGKPMEDSGDSKLDLSLEIEKGSKIGEMKCMGGFNDGAMISYPKCGFSPGALDKDELEDIAIKKKIIKKEQKGKLNPSKKKFAKKLAALHIACDNLKEKIEELRPKKELEDSKMEWKKNLGAYKQFYKKLEKATEDCKELKATECPPVPEKIPELSKKD